MSSTTPPPPKSGGSGPFIVAAVVMLLLMGGLILWKMTGRETKSAEPAPSAVATAAEPELEQPPPPPPPPPVEEDAGKAPEKQIVKKGNVSGGSTCAAVCTGEEPAGLRTILSSRAGQARGCYQRALLNNNTLQGRMMVNVKISSTGQVCSANIAKNEVGDPGLTSCVLQVFRSATFPSPKGGCVEANVPLNFERKE
jgi:TonB family protein